MDKLVASLIAAAGLVLYAGLTFFMYGRYYGDLGVSPSDVGINYSNGLTRAIGLIVLWLGIFGIALVAVAILGRVRNYGWKQSVARAAIVPTVITLVMLTIYVWWGSPAQRALAVEGGHDTFGIGSVFGLPLIDIRSPRVTVSWTQGNPAPSICLQKDELIYLGFGDGDDVLYDVTTHSVIRIPGNDVVLSESAS